MPGSLLSRVRRNESTRSDRSDLSADSCKSSGKKVSFNRAVRVKKFPRRTDALHDDPDELDNKRFWFNAYKNTSPDLDSPQRRSDTQSDYLRINPLEDQTISPSALSHNSNTKSSPHHNIVSKVPEMRLSADASVGTSGDTMRSSQQNAIPAYRRNHVRKLVTKFNDESHIKYHDDETDSPIRVKYNGPLEPPVDYTDNTKYSQRKSTTSDGVRALLGMGNTKTKRNPEQTNDLVVWRNNQTNLKKRFDDDTSEDEPPYRTSILLADDYVNNNNHHKTVANGGQVDFTENKINLLPSHFWDSGDQLVSDVSRYESTVDRNDQGEKVFKTVEEGSKVWKHETRTVFEQEDVPQQKVKTLVDIKGRKGSPSSHLSSQKDYEVLDKNKNGVTKNRAIQCNRSKDSGSNSSSVSTLANSHRVIRPSQDGYVSAYSDVPAMKLNGTLHQPKKQDDYSYSQMDANQKLLGKKSSSTLSLSSKSGKVKSSQKSFGFRLKKAFGATLPDEKNNGNTYTPAKDEDGKWYDIDADVTAADERDKGRHDISEVRLELNDKKNENDYAKNETLRKEKTGSVVRELDLRKREIVYENTPLRSRTEVRAEAGGLCYREAREDYRRGMAGKQVSSTSTLGRSALQNKSREPLSKAFTLDRKPPRPPASSNKQNSSTVKIMLNGHEVDDVDALAAKQQPLRNTTRGGLAAAFKARQKAAIKRSESLSGSRHSVSNIGLSSGASSTVSSDGEASRRRRAHVTYSQATDSNRSDSDDYRSGLSRTQSLHTISRPPKYQKHILKNGSPRRYSPNRNTTGVSRIGDEEDVDTLSPLRSDTNKEDSSSNTSRKGELHRRHSMPKDSKFSWLKWKIKPKDREL